MTVMYTDINVLDRLLFLIIEVESKNINLSLERIKEEIKNKVITESDLERVKKVFISDFVFILDNPSRIASVMVNELSLNKDILFDELDIIKSITLEDINEIRNNIDLDNSSTVIAYPKEG